MVANALLAHHAELGFVTIPGIAKLAKLTDQVLANKDAIPSYASAAEEILIRQIMGVSSQIAVLDQQLAAWPAESEASRRPAATPGIGVIPPTASAAIVPDPEQLRPELGNASIRGRCCHELVIAGVAGAH